MSDNPRRDFLIGFNMLAGVNPPDQAGAVHQYDEIVRKTSISGLLAPRLGDPQNLEAKLFGGGQLADLANLAHAKGWTAEQIKERLVTPHNQLSGKNYTLITVNPDSVEGRRGNHYRIITAKELGVQQKKAERPSRRPRYMPVVHEDSPAPPEAPPDPDPLAAVLTQIEEAEPGRTRYKNLLNNLLAAAFPGGIEAQRLADLVNDRLSSGEEWRECEQKKRAGEIAEDAAAPDSYFALVNAHAQDRSVDIGEATYLSLHTIEGIRDPLRKETAHFPAAMGLFDVVMDQFDAREDRRTRPERPLERFVTDEQRESMREKYLDIWQQEKGARKSR